MSYLHLLYLFYHILYVHMCVLFYIIIVYISHKNIVIYNHFTLGALSLIYEYMAPPPGPRPAPPHALSSRALLVARTISAFRSPGTL